jgi:2-polyprenyl-6-methoxyphenol hydroxylase-like FAD-dependent oxidoreductase
MTELEKISVDCCVVGGGPAGMMAGLLFARAGCRTLVLEKHADFLRDFRGDTVHPSTLEALGELGLLDGFLQRPHQELTKLSGIFGDERVELADFSSLKTRCRFIAFVPQWHFLDFLAEAAGSLPGFDLRMETEGNGLIEESGKVVGVLAEGPDGPLEVRSRLVIGADGRHSTLRDLAGLQVETVGAPIDVLWFRLPKEGRGGERPLFNAAQGKIVIAIDRGDYYQCAFVIPKGGADRVRERGLEEFRASVAAAVPQLAGSVGSIASFEEVKLLTVAIDRLEEWSRPGLLMIGDSAHAMSPVGGVGINLAIQDAIAAANLLAGPLAGGTLEPEMLERVRKRRLWPVRATQFIQVQAQNRILAPILSGPASALRPPLFLRLVSRTPLLKRLFARLVGLGFRPEHIRSPERHALKPPAAE